MWHALLNFEAVILPHLWYVGITVREDTASTCTAGFASEREAKLSKNCDSSLFDGGGIDFLAAGFRILSLLSDKLT